MIEVIVVCLVGVYSGQAVDPLIMEAMEGDMKKQTRVEKEPAKEKTKGKKGAGVKGRRKGSKNKNRSEP